MPSAPPPSDFPVLGSPLPSVISTANLSTANSSKPFSFTESFWNSRLIRAITQAVSTALFWLRSTHLGSYLFGSNPSQQVSSIPSSERISASINSDEELTESLFTMEGLAHQYVQGKIFDTCVINGEQFALITDRSIRATSQYPENIVLDLPNHHLLILDPVVAHSLTLKGKSVTVIAKMTLTGDFDIEVPIDTGNIICYGAPINVGKNVNWTACGIILRGYRIVTKREEENGQVQEEIVDYLALVKRLFKKGITNRSSAATALAIFKTGHEVLFKEGKVSRPDIFALWAIPFVRGESEGI